MKKSTRTGVLLALGVTVVSSNMISKDNAEPRMPFGIQTAQAAQVAQAALNMLDGSWSYTDEDAAIEKRKKALMSRVRNKLAASESVQFSKANSVESR